MFYWGYCEYKTKLKRRCLIRLMSLFCTKWTRRAFILTSKFVCCVKARQTRMATWNKCIRSVEMKLNKNSIGAKFSRLYCKTVRFYHTRIDWPMPGVYLVALVTAIGMVIMESISLSIRKVFFFELCKHFNGQ